MATLDQIRAQLDAAGHPALPDGHPVADGKPHRYGPKRKHWYSLHEIVKAGQVIGYTGAFGCWSGDDNGAQPFVWQGSALAPEDIAATKARQEATAREEEHKRQHAAKLAANRARDQWQKASDDVVSSYLDRKQVTPEGVRCDEAGDVLVPMFNYRDGIRLVGLQKITPDGAKRFNKGMEKKGALFLLGDIEPESRIAMLAEGYATARSARMATGDAIPVMVCFDAGNLIAAARYLRDAYPDLHLLFCADDDWKTGSRLREFLTNDYGCSPDFPIGDGAVRVEARGTWFDVTAECLVDENGVQFHQLRVGNDAASFVKRFENAGLKRAHEAVAAVGNASVVFPQFAARGERKLTDFNDLHVEEGLHVVKAQLEAALLAALALPADAIKPFPHLQAVEAADDPLYAAAFRLVTARGKASLSLLQREMRIGQTRASKLLDVLERNGIVSPESNGRRKVLPAPSSAAAGTPEWDGTEGENGAYTWEQRLRRTDRGALKPDLDNVIDILSNSPRWDGVLTFEQFSQRILKRTAPPFQGGADGEWTEHDDMLLTDWFGRTWSITPRRDVVCEAVEVVARRNSCHVVLDYLRALEHDGVERVDTWLIDYLGVENTEYARLVGRKWLLGAVGRVMEPGCKMDNVLILEGPQGAGKSRAIKMLFSESWSTEASVNLGDPRSVELLRGHWALELAELDALNKSDSAAAKRFITTQVDTFRPAYARRVVKIPRQFVIVGTVNFDTYLKDESGNRRFWPVKVAPYVNLPALRDDRDQIWAEAFKLYGEWVSASAEAAGTVPAPWQVLPDEVPLFEAEQAARYEGDVFESLIAEFIQYRPRATVEEIMFDCLKLEISKSTKPEQRRVGSAMKSLGWVRKRESTGARRWYYEPPPENAEAPAAPRGSIQRGDDDEKF
jgi:predicted P-loop ATPase/phage/plasmid primase-like uncharacterized protein